MKKIKIILKYNKKKKTLDKGKINLSKDYIKILNFEKNLFYQFKFKDDKIELSTLSDVDKFFSIEKKDTHKNIIYAKKMYKGTVYKDKIYSIDIPLFILKKWGIEENPYVQVKILANKIIIEKTNEDFEEIKNKGVYTFKVEKGGRG